jgi:hypothetical protein
VLRAAEAVEQTLLAGAGVHSEDLVGAVGVLGQVPGRSAGPVEEEELGRVSPLDERGALPCGEVDPEDVDVERARVHPGDDSAGHGGLGVDGEHP